MSLKKGSSRIFLQAILIVIFSLFIGVIYNTISKALNLPFEEFEKYYPKVERLLTKDKNIITYCDGTECEASLFLARLLRDKGFKNLKIFFGGWTEWNKAGLPVQKS